MSNSTLAEATGAIVDQAAQCAQGTIASTQRLAHDALQRGLDGVRDASQQVRESAQHASHSTVNYIKDEPVKAMLIAAATGAALMALIGLLNQSRARS